MNGKMRIGVHENGNTQEWEYVRTGMGVRENKILDTRMGVCENGNGST